MAGLKLQAGLVPHVGQKPQVWSEVQFIIEHDQAIAIRK